MERTIKITGKGKISVKPDTTRLIITQSAVKDDYETTIQNSSDMKNSLNCALREIGFRKEDLKTLYFHVDKENESYRDKEGNWIQKFVGYRFTHRMKLQFLSDNTMLGKVLGVIACCSGNPDFTIEYTVSDPEAVKNELLAKAVEDSKAKAVVLSKAAGVNLKEIITIDYSWSELDIVSDAVYEAKACRTMRCDKSINLDIEADDIDVADTVTVVWAIE